jgi:hypothetical protein
LDQEPKFISVFRGFANDEEAIDPTANMTLDDPKPGFQLNEPVRSTAEDLPKRKEIKQPIKSKPERMHQRSTRVKESRAKDFASNPSGSRVDSDDEDDDTNWRKMRSSVKNQAPASS